MTVPSDGVGAQFPADLKCACGRRITKTTARVFLKGKYVCGECMYFIERGEMPPGRP